jgi:DNA-binding transcriptional LysR family regulator
MDRIDLFRIFCRVVDCASFTRAADQLGLPRSSVSLAVRDLEGRLGTRLLHRTTRKIAPTQDGLLFYERSLSVIAQLEDAEGMFRQDDQALTGRVYVDMPGRIGRLIVAPALPEFLDMHPGVDIILGVSDRAANLIEDALDCVLRVGPLVDPRWWPVLSGISPLSMSPAPPIWRAMVSHRPPPIWTAITWCCLPHRPRRASNLSNGWKAENCAAGG